MTYATRVKFGAMYENSRYGVVLNNMLTKLFQYKKNSTSINISNKTIHKKNQNVLIWDFNGPSTEYKRINSIYSGDQDKWTYITPIINNIQTNKTKKFRYTYIGWI